MWKLVSSQIWITSIVAPSMAECGTKRIFFRQIERFDSHNICIKRAKVAYFCTWKNYGFYTWILWKTGEIYIKINQIFWIYSKLWGMSILKHFTKFFKNHSWNRAIWSEVLQLRSKLWQATQHQASQEGFTSREPFLAGWDLNFETVALLF